MSRRFSFVTADPNSSLTARERSRSPCVTMMIVPLWPWFGTLNTQNAGRLKIWGSHSGGYEVYYLLGYNTVWSVESPPAFRRNISPPSSGSNKRRLVTCFHTGILLDLFFDLEDGGNMFLRNVGWLSTDYMALYHRGQYSSKKWLNCLNNFIFSNLNATLHYAPLETAGS
jgi:hypothetical protein